jgi:hypothetical protein
MEIKKIIIVGGGSAGWMTASTLIKAFPKKKITVIESPNVPVIGVGESTLATIKMWTNFLGIEDKDFMPACDASYKLGIMFTDFYKKGTQFCYPFGKPETSGCTSGLNDWWFKKSVYPKTPNSNYAESFYPQMSMINQNKFFSDRDEKISFNKETDAAYHFNAVKFGQWLKDNYAIPRGVKYLKEHIHTIKQNNNGIVSLNNKHKADLYIDCTGFKSLLLSETLKEPFESYSDLLPNDSAWVAQKPFKNKKKELVNYTNCTALENGWVWNVPLWSRIGTGYVYSSDFVSDEDALKQFQKHLGTKELEFRNIKSRVGIHKRLWVKNVVAIGLSASFIEPLEGNGLFSVHEFLRILLRNMKRGAVSQWDKDNFTHECKSTFKCFAEFVAMHYALSHRNDTPYWKSNLNKNWDKKLINLKPSSIAGILWSSNQRQGWQFNENGGLHCIAAGMNWAPTDVDEVMFKNLMNEKVFIEGCKYTAKQLDNRKKNWDKIIKNKTSYYDYLKNEIYKN